MLHGNWMIAAMLDAQNGEKEYMKLDPDPELFRGPEKEAFEFCRGHLQKYGKLPARETVAKHVPDVTLPEEIPEPPAYYYAKMQERHRHLKIKEAIVSAADLLNSKSVDEAQDVITDMVYGLNRSTFRNRVIDYAQEGGTLIKEHLIAMTKGYGVGVPFGWPSVDEISSGMQPGDFISLLGRPGKGKTFLLLYMMLMAWKKSFSTMFVTMEMNPKLIVQRIAALDTQTSAKQIKMGNVSSKKWEGMRGQLVENKNRPPLWIIEGGLSASVDQILLQVVEKKPDVVYIDGAYMVQPSQEGFRMSNWERIQKTAEALKRDLAEGQQIPVVASYQFNREGAKQQKKGGANTVDLEDIAGADAIGQLSSLALGMFEENTVETMEKRHVRVLKGRYGETGGFDINWIFDRPPFMDFSEIKEETLDDLANL